MKTITIAAALLLALALAAGSALAGGPFTFSTRALLERPSPSDLVKIAGQNGLGKLTVRSIGCAKGGIGRVYCAVVTTGSQGTQRWAYTIECPSDKSAGCTGTINPWPKR